MKKKIRIGLLILAAVLVVGFVYFALSGRNTKKEWVYTPGPYSDEQLQQINQNNILNDASLSDLEKKCDVQFLDGDSPEKTAVVTGETQALVIHYDEDGKLQFQKTYSLIPSSKDFDGLSENESINSVMAIDPTGDYGVLYTGRNDTPRLSYHFTQDGYCIEVSYDSNNNITGIEKTMLENG